MNNLDRLSELQLKLRKARKLHGAQVESLKQKLSTLSIELQCLQTSIACELSEVEQILDRIERSERHQRSATSTSSSVTFDGSKFERQVSNGNGAEVTAL